MTETTNEVRMMEIRIAEFRDCMELSKLKHKMWCDTYRSIYPDEKIDHFDFERNEDKFRSLVTAADIQLFVGEDHGEIIAYMSCGAPIRKFKDYTQEIGLLYVRKDYQGSGLGKRLFLLGRDQIRQSGTKEFFVSCNLYNRNARAFYEKMGGVIVDVHDDLEDPSNAQVKFLYVIN